MQIISTFRTLIASGLLGLGALGSAAYADTGKLDLSQYRGKVVYVDFWASWCGPCKLSFPFMKSLASRYPSNDLVVVTVNLDRTRDRADAFLRQVGGGLPVVYDEKGELARKYKVSDMPTSLLIDRSGVIRFTHRGFLPAKQGEYLAHVTELVRER